MRRRQFLGHMAVASGCIAGSSTSDKIVAWKRLSNLDDLGGFGANARLQDFTAKHGCLYGLTFDLPQRQSRVYCVTAEGKARFSHALPPREFFSRLFVRDSGSLILFHHGAGPPAIVEVAEDGRIIASTPIDRIPLTACLSGDALVGVLADGSIEWRDLGGNRSTRRWHDRVLSPLLKPSLLPAVLCEPLSATKAAVIDQENAKLSVFNVASGVAGPVVPIQCQEVSSSLAVYEEDRKKLPDLAVGGKGVVAPQFIVVYAAASDGAGALYSMISPIDIRRGAVVLQLDESARVTRAMTYAIPDRSGQKFKTPLKMAVLGPELAFAFAEGRVAWYSLN
jgi:hypothetical protein